MLTLLLNLYYRHKAKKKLKRLAIMCVVSVITNMIVIILQERGKNYGYKNGKSSAGTTQKI